MINKTILKTITFSAIIALIIVSGCYYDNEEDLYPQVIPCDTSNVTYSGTIKPTIDQYCISCHNQGNLQGGINLEGYNNVVNAGNIPPGTYGSLYGVVSHINDNPMPKDQPKIPDCKILQIELWIADGTPER